MRSVTRPDFKNRHLKSAQNQENTDFNRLCNFSKQIKSRIRVNSPSDSSLNRQQKTPNFINCISGYIKSMADRETQPINLSKKHITVNNCQKSVKKDSHPSQDYRLISNSIEKEKQVNKHLQKCVIEMQKVLWERSENIQKIEDQLRRRQKESKRQRVKNRVKIQQEKDCSHWAMNKLNSECSESNVSEESESESQSRRRRKTEMPRQIQQMLIKTLAVKSKSKQRG